MRRNLAADSITCHAGKVCEHKCGHRGYDAACAGYVFLWRVLCHLQFQVSVSAMHELSLHHGALEML